MDDVPPPLPVKQRSKSVLSEQNSVPHDAGMFGTVSLQQRHIVGSDTVPSSQWHDVSLPSADFIASLDNVLAELSDASAPKKPPRSARLSSYDNITPSCDSVVGNGKCFKFPSSSTTPSSSTNTWRSSSDEPLNSFVLPNHARNSDGSMTEYFVSSSREVSRDDNGSVSQTSYRVASMTAGSVPTQPTTTVAPPLPMKLKHSQSQLHFAIRCPLCKANKKGAIYLVQCRWGVDLPFIGLEPVDY